jgi:hypothetical protein
VATFGLEAGKQLKVSVFSGNVKGGTYYDVIPAKAGIKKAAVF